MGRNYGVKSHEFRDDNYLNAGAWCLFVGLVSLPAMAVFGSVFFYLALFATEW